MRTRRDRVMQLGAVDGGLWDGTDQRIGRRRLHVGSGAGAVRRRDAPPVSRRRRTHLDRVPVGQHPRRLADRRAVRRGARQARSGRSARPRARATVDRVVFGRLRRGAGSPRRLRRHRPPPAGGGRRGWGAVRAVAKPAKSWDPYPVTVHTTSDPALLSATLRATWPDGVCTDTGIYPEYKVEMPLLPMY